MSDPRADFRRRHREDLEQGFDRATWGLFYLTAGEPYEIREGNSRTTVTPDPVGEAAILLDEIKALRGKVRSFLWANDADAKADEENRLYGIFESAYGNVSDTEAMSRGMVQLVIAANPTGASYDRDAVASIIAKTHGLDPSDDEDMTEWVEIIDAICR